jgi:MFS transporter, putative metabolite:H+ symporter
MTAPLSPYQRRLVIFLSVATFFDGYDFFALAQILPSLRAEMGLTKSDAGWLVAVVNAGTILAALLVRRADVWGRRRVLMVTITGYTLCSLLTALAPGPVSFAVIQLVARVFLIGEWAVAMVIAAEEFPAERRGMVIGVIQACATLGTIVCAAVVPFLLTTPLGWRTVYLVGAVPLVIVAYARRGLRETRRFEARPAAASRPSLFALFRTPYRRRAYQMALIWGLTYVATQNGITFWKEFAIGERGFSEAEVGLSLSVAAAAAMPLVFLVGKLLDVLGRRRGALVIFTVTAAGIFLAYTLRSRAGLTGALVLGVFGASAVLPVMNAYTTELFPTELRGDAFAWTNNLLGRIGYVASPIFVGVAAEAVGWGPVLAATAAFPLAALVLILWLLPETSGRELEDTSAPPGA